MGNIEFVVGIDPDTRGLAWCLMQARVNDPPGESELVRCGYIKRADPKYGYVEDYADTLMEFFRELEDTECTIYFEDIFMRGVTGFKSLARVQGEIYFAALASKFPSSSLRCVQPSAWQSTVLGWYDISKDQPMKERIREAAHKIAGDDYEFHTQHAMDACCIAAYGAQEQVFLMLELERSR